VTIAKRPSCGHGIQEEDHIFTKNGRKIFVRQIGKSEQIEMAIEFRFFAQAIWRLFGHRARQCREEIHLSGKSARIAGWVEQPKPITLAPRKSDGLRCVHPSNAPLVSNRKIRGSSISDKNVPGTQRFILGTRPESQMLLSHGGCCHACVLLAIDHLRSDA
jgi:hypothetical protein